MEKANERFVRVVLVNCLHCDKHNDKGEYQDNFHCDKHNDKGEYQDNFHCDKHNDKGEYQDNFHCVASVKCRYYSVQIMRLIIYEDCIIKTKFLNSLNEEDLFITNSLLFKQQTLILHCTASFLTQQQNRQTNIICILLGH